MPLTPETRRKVDQIRDYLYGGGYPDPMNNAEQLAFLFYFYLAEGQEVGEMVVDVPGMPAMTVPVVTEAAVAKGGFAIRLRAALGILTKRLMAEIGS